MKFLSVETSTKNCVVAVSDEKGFICGVGEVFERGRSDALMVLIQRCLKKARLDLEAVDGFGVGVGPGSFTGIRIALSVVKGLSFATGKPCFAFSSLEAIATAGLGLPFERLGAPRNRPTYWRAISGTKVPEISPKFLGVLIDAKRNSFYWNSYEKQHRCGIPSLRRLAKKDRLLERRQALEAIKKTLVGKKVVVLSGDGVGLLKDDLCRLCKQETILCGENHWYPTPESIARLTLEKFRAGAATDAFGLTAVYLFAHDCQVRLNRKKEEGRRRRKEVV